MIKDMIKILTSLLLLLAIVGPASAASAQGTPLVLAFYYAWFDGNTWTSSQPADMPVEPYSSADRATIERHVAQARGAGIDGLVQSWYGPSENPTETNFRTLLDAAQAQGLQAAVDFEVSGPFFGDDGTVTSALATLLNTHVQHPAYLRYQGKPVVFFWRQQRFSVDQWISIRSQVDPNHNTFWIAEGVDIAYQAVFDGHHLYSIAWAASPPDQLAKWANRVQAYEADHGVNRLWVATTMPGYDDTRLPRTDAFAVSRRGGDYFRETWRGALASQPDMIIINSFNEWLEGTQIEPSATYGNLYLDITRELMTALKGSPPPEPAAIPAAQAETPAPPEATPPGPHVRVATLTNVRNGPGLTFDRVGQLPVGSTAPVIGQVEGGSWWQIEFEPGPAGQGWISAEVVEFVGDPAEAPVIAAPTPTAPTATAPAASGEDSAEPEDGTPQVEIPAGEVNVRSGPNLNSELLGQLGENSPAPVVGRTELGNWWLIEYEGGENGLAWVADAVVDFVGDRQGVPVVETTAEGEVALPAPTPTTPLIAGVVQVEEPINVRAAPSVEGDLIGGLYLGNSADVLAISEDGEWWQIDFPEGPDGSGWVSAEFVEFEGDRTLVPIFEVGTPTPTPGPTDTPTPTPGFTPPPPVAPTLAPTATSIYQSTAAALLAERGTPDPARTASSTRRGSSWWEGFPWGILSIVLVVIFLWYQFYLRRRQ